MMLLEVCRSIFRKMGCYLETCENKKRKGGSKDLQNFDRFLQISTDICSTISRSMDLPMPVIIHYKFRRIYKLDAVLVGVESLD